MNTRELASILQQHTIPSDTTLAAIDTILAAPKAPLGIWKIVTTPQIPYETRRWCLTLLMLASLTYHRFYQGGAFNRWKTAIVAQMRPQLELLSAQFKDANGSQSDFNEYVPLDLLDFTWAILTWKLASDKSSFVSSTELSDILEQNLITTCLTQAPKNPLAEQVATYICQDDEHFEIAYNILINRRVNPWVKRYLARLILDASDPVLPKEFSTYNGLRESDYAVSNGATRLLGTCFGHGSRYRERSPEKEKLLKKYGELWQAEAILWLYRTSQFNTLAGLVFWSKFWLHTIAFTHSTEFSAILRYILTTPHTLEEDDLFEKTTDPDGKPKIQLEFLTQMYSLVAHTDLADANDLLTLISSHITADQQAAKVIPGSQTSIDEELEDLHHTKAAMDAYISLVPDGSIYKL
jgi:hypothetical protein